MKGMRLASRLLNIVIIFLAFVIALEQIGIEVAIIKNTFLIIIGSLGLGVALAIGLAFGLGMKGQANQMFGKFKKSI
jgi:hypothetical protein